MWLKLFIIYYIFLIKIVVSEEVGDRCSPNERENDGSCVLVTDCEVAVRAIKLFFHHPFRRCGFHQEMEIVCCPTKDYVLPEPSKTKTTSALHTVQTSTTPLSVEKVDEELPKRIADIECQKILESRGPPLDLHITGGVTASPGEFPHMVALGYSCLEGYQFQCGGSLISDTFILTAAHCVDTLNSIKPAIARMGVIRIGERTFNEETDGRVAEIILHPQYTRRNKYHDLALLRLEKPVKCNATLSPICLYTSQTDPSIELIVTGWGKTSAMGIVGSDILLKAKVTAVQKHKCRESYTRWRRLPNGITDEQICAVDKEGLRDACQGDSGGPLQGLTGTDGLYRLVAVTSFGRGCGSGVPGVYSRVSHNLDWIESQVWPK